MLRLTAMAVVGAIAAAIALHPAQAAAPASLESAYAALDLLAGSRRALGDTQGPPAERLSLDYRGDLLWLNQGPVPSRPMRFGYRQQAHFIPADGLVKVRLEFAGPESSFQRSAALAESSQSSDLVELTSHSPHAVVRSLGAGARNLLFLGSEGGESMIAGVLHGRLVRLAFGPDLRPKSLSYAIVDDLHGDAVRRVEYLDYSRRSGWMVPGRIRQSDGGRVTHDLVLQAFEAGSAEPEWAAKVQPRTASAPQDDAPGIGIETLAPGIHVLRNLGGGDYHGMLVALADGLMVLEAPATLGDGSELRRAVAKISAKPILYVVPTHHHDDHSAGAAALAGDGATILTTTGNVQYFTTMAASRRRLSGKPRSTARPSVRALRDGERIGPVQFLNIGSGTHAAEHLVFYFPDHGILFHSDMGRFNPDGSVEPARPQTCRLLGQIEARGLKVQRIVSGHGRTGTIADLRRTTSLPGANCG